MHKREFDLKIALFTRDEVKKSTGNKIQAENGEEQKGHSGRFFNLNFLYIFQYHILCMFMLILANQIGFYFIFELFTCNSSC